MSESVTDDSILVRQMLAGEERAFTAFFETYFPRIYRFALPRLGRNEDVAKDVVQATLVKAMRKLGDWRGEAALFTWLCQICRREIADHVRSQRRHSEKVVLIEDSEEVRAALEAIEAPPWADVSLSRWRTISHAETIMNNVFGARLARPVNSLRVCFEFEWSPTARRLPASERW